MKTLVVVFLGGGLGSVSRFFLGKWIPLLPSLTFPFGTLTVNILACFSMGLFVGLIDYREWFSPLTRLFWVVGFCGGFSTFSTFSYEAIVLLQNESVFSSMLYISLSLFVGILATFAGLYLGGVS